MVACLWWIVAEYFNIWYIYSSLTQNAFGFQAFSPDYSKLIHLSTYELFHVFIFALGSHWYSEIQFDSNPEAQFISNLQMTWYGIIHSSPVLKYHINRTHFHQTGSDWSMDHESIRKSSDVCNLTTTFCGRFRDTFYHMSHNFLTILT